MTRFLLIRHATTDAVGKHLSGRMPGVHLNDEGSAQAQALANRLKTLPIAAVYSSPLERAMETATPIAAGANVEVLTNDAFLELDFGDWSNQSFADLAHQPSFQNFNSFRSGTRIPGGELMAAAQLRMVAGLESLQQVHSGQTIAVISHADIIKSAIAFYAGIHLDLFHRLEISPASVSVLDLFADNARIVLINDIGVLKAVI